MAKHVALLLATYADIHGRNAHPGAARLAKNAGLGERTVFRHLATLQEAKWISRNGGDDPVDNSHGGRVATVYNLHIPDGATLPLETGLGPVDKAPHP